MRDPIDLVVSDPEPLPPVRRMVYPNAVVYHGAGRGGQPEVMWVPPRMDEAIRSRPEWSRSRSIGDVEIRWLLDAVDVPPEGDEPDRI